MSNYIGDELSLFEHAKNWKLYYTDILKYYINGDVVEVGAGLGGTTIFLQNSRVKSWICIEPDSKLIEILINKVKQNILPNFVTPINGNINSINSLKDTFIYIDVIEHIENDKKELKDAYDLLNKNGHILIIVPAFNFLYNDFDKSIGHFRRYTKKTISDIIPLNGKVLKIQYLDSLGFFTSLVNKYILKQNYPKLSQILFWDKILIPFSKFFDHLFHFKFGKSLLVVIKKEDYE